MNITDADLLETLVIIKNEGLPADESTRIMMIYKMINDTTINLFYDDICAYLPEFQAKYSLDYIRILLRKYDIRGKAIIQEIQSAKATQEEKAILFFFFKGRAI